MGDTAWAYTTTTRAPEVPRRCRSNRNVNSAGDPDAPGGRSPNRNRTRTGH